MNIAEQHYLPKALTIAMSLITLGIQQAHAEATTPSITNETAKSVDQLPTISVMASRGTALKDMDISTTVLTRTQISNAPETSIDQIINKIPGIVVPARPSTQIHPTGQMLNIRGFGTSTNGLTLVLLDGIPVNDPYFRTINWAQIPKDQVERIEVIRGGGATSLWGNMAMGGVINIVTRHPENKTELSVSAGSFDSQSYGISTGYKIDDHWEVGLSYDGSRSDGYKQIPEQYRHPAMTTTQSQTDNVYFKTTYTPTDFSQYFLTLQASQTSEDHSTYALANNQWNTYRASLGGKTDITKDTSLNLLGWYQYTEMETQNASNNGYTLATPNNGTPFVSQKEKAEYDSFGTSMYLQTAWRNLTDLKVGVDYRQIGVKDPLNIYNASGYQGNITAEANHQFAGIFAQGVYRPFVIPLDITLGLRQDYWKASDAKTHGNYRGSDINNALPDQSSNHFNPRIGLKYQVNDMLDLRAAAYKNFSAPGLNQMYRSFVSGTGYTIPNTDLMAQTNKGAEAGFDFKYQDFSLSGTYFNNKVNNYIDYATVKTGCSVANNYCGTGVTSAQTLKQYINAGDAKMQGFELIANWQIFERLSLNAGYTRTKAELVSTTNPASVTPTGQQLGQIPLWNVSAGAAWQATDKLNIALQLRDFPDYWNNTAHTQKNDGALTADVSVNYQANDKLKLYLIAQNIGDTSYYDQGLSYLADGSVNISGSGTVPSYALPLAVTVGAKYTF
ncbi:TonB-dependent receptor [Acinetobacter seifertii]|uniref:TonB-dependent receptor plug domain-containing protein n=1 Tax=Acinetobacter seifertii TaxID=1530123 RepID=UPI00321B8005